MQPALAAYGRQMQLTLACSLRAHNALPISRIRVFQDSSHLPFVEEPEAYFAVLTAFLDAHRA